MQNRIEVATYVFATFPNALGKTFCEYISIYAIGDINLLCLPPTPILGFATSHYIDQVHMPLGPWLRGGVSDVVVIHVDILVACC